MMKVFRKFINAITRIVKIDYRYFSFVRKYFQFKKLMSDYPQRSFKIQWKNIIPYLKDNTANTSFEAHYIYHPAWAARIIRETAPEYHVDISSTLHFCTIVSAFLPVKFYDYRPASIMLENLTSEKANLLNLPFEDNSIASLSCMHTVEHIGLGRYGDELDPNGDIKAMKELSRVLAGNGNLLFVVPIGNPKICFNAHRIYSYDQIINLFSELQLEEFMLIPDNAETEGLIYVEANEKSKEQSYACGCFWFKKVSEVV